MSPYADPCFESIRAVFLALLFVHTTVVVSTCWAGDQFQLHFDRSWQGALLLALCRSWPSRDVPSSVPIS